MKTFGTKFDTGQIFNVFQFSQNSFQSLNCCFEEKIYFDKTLNLFKVSTYVPLFKTHYSNVTNTFEKHSSRQLFIPPNSQVVLNKFIF